MGNTHHKIDEQPKPSNQLGSDKIPIQEINYTAKVTGTLANVTLTQIYVNKSTTQSEVIFRSQVDPAIVIHGLTIKTKTKTIDGKIMPKEKAEQKYSQASASGNQAFLVKEDETPDSISISIGKLEPKEEIEVSIHFSILSSIEDESWCLSLPLRIIGQINKVQDNTYVSNIKSTINISIESYSPITRIACRNHSPKISFSDKEHCKADITFAQEKNLKGDFILLYRFADMKTPYLLYEEIPETKEFAYALSFTPTYVDNASDTSTVDSDQNKKIADDTLQGSGEFIFLLDTSGSMSGDKIKMAVDSLIYFMKSLPPNSKFNVVLFDSTFNLYFGSSVLYTEENVDVAMKRIKSESFRFGGTEIFQPLSSIFDQTHDPKYPRVIFMITDGCVSDSSEVVQLIKRNSKQNIVHALGIGSDVDRNLIVKCAKAGNGCYKFVIKPDEISANVIEMLSHSIKPAYVDMSTSWNEKPVLEWPNHNSMQLSYQGNQIFTCAIFDKKLTGNVSVSFIDTLSMEKKQLSIGVDNVKQVNQLGKIIAHNCIKDDQQKGLGIKYKVLCKETAIYAEVKSLEAITGETTKIEVSLEKVEEAEQETKSSSSRGGGGTFFGNFSTSPTMKCCMPPPMPKKCMPQPQPICCMPPEKCMPQSICCMPPEKCMPPLICCMPSPVQSIMMMPSSIKQDACKPPQNIVEKKEKKMKKVKQEEENFCFDEALPEADVGCAMNAPCDDIADQQILMCEKEVNQLAMDEDEEEEQPKCKMEEEKMSIPNVQCSAKAENVIICAKEEKTVQVTKKYKAGLEGVIEGQKLSGIWEIDAVCAELHRSKEEIISCMPAKINNEVAWCTIIMIAVLNKRYAKDQAKWKLVANKAINKLKSMGVIYADYQSEATKII